MIEVREVLASAMIVFLVISPKNLSASIVFRISVFGESSDTVTRPASSIASAMAMAITLPSVLWSGRQAIRTGSRLILRLWKRFAYSTRGIVIGFFASSSSAVYRSSLTEELRKY